jgi:hypothetical protein
MCSGEMKLWVREIADPIISALNASESTPYAACARRMDSSDARARFLTYDLCRMVGRGPVIDRVHGRRPYVGEVSDMFMFATVNNK